MDARPAPFTVSMIAGFRLAAPDPAAALAFLHDAVQAEPAGIGLARLGDAQMQVTAGPPLPPLAADEAGFQHLALVVADMAAAHARVAAGGVTAVSTGGPVRLPPASGGVTAWKFRSPWNQPLELLQAPTEAWRARARETGALFLGVDHTAVVCRDPVRSVAALQGMGFTEGASSHNIGAEQDILDGLAGADLHIRTLFTPSAGPHIELLDYRQADRVGLAESAVTLMLSGPDGERPIDLVTLCAGSLSQVR